MRPTISYAATFLTGAICAAIGVSLAWALSLDLMIDGIVAEHSHLQAILLRRAQREDNRLAQVVHAMNLADLEEGRGLGWAERWRETTLIDRATYPIDALTTLYLFRNLDPAKLERGREMVRGIARARVALVLESAGFGDLATREWESAHALLPTTKADELRALADCCTYDSPEHLAADEAYLESRSYEELGNRLAALNAEHDDEK